MNMQNISDYVGLVGVVIVLIAYLFLQLEKTQSNSGSYLISNFIGSIFIIFSLIYNWNLSAFIVEVMWCIISLIGMLRIKLQRA